MQLTTVIFDMDGLLIDSEPLWEEAAKEILARFNVTLTKEQYHMNTGLRTREFLAFWFGYFGIGHQHIPQAEEDLIDLVIAKVSRAPKFLPGVAYILEFFKERNFHIGLASSSPMRLINVVVELGQFGQFLETRTSAEFLTHGKPHPQVYLECAAQLGASPLQCIAFEDSFNGMIAAKAARMKCVVGPAYEQQKQLRWHAADLRLTSLANFNDLLMNGLAGQASTEMIQKN
jgi:mannitol-1-/sugar-/sorbitol-6-/2-deoxyglucose-6-phosphatase